MHRSITEQDAAFYREQGYFIFRQILPASLITDLRAVAAKALEIARKQSGPQAQRLAAIDQHPEVNGPAVRAFFELDELNRGLRALLSERHALSAPGNLTLLFEPGQKSWATEWHRDWRDHMSADKFDRLFEHKWETTAADPNLFNQMNCALYEDPCTWFVPGSHRRLNDTPEEVRASKAADRANVENRDGRRSEEQQEIYLYNYCAGMPGAVQLRLQPGDLAIYRSVAWHTGSYVPYRRRATLHCSAVTPEYLAFWKKAEAAAN